MEFTNAEIARKLKEVAAAHTLKGGNLFQIRAYENAASTIDGLSSEAKDLWDEGKLEQIPGVGESLRSHLEELFKTGQVKHWQEVKKGIPEEVFQFLEIPGVGPKTAFKLSKLGASSLEVLKNKLESGALLKKGLSQKIAEKILSSLIEMGETKIKRMMLPYALAQAERILEYLRKSPAIEKADVLGSLRRMAATIGDLDFAVSSDQPKEAVDYITEMPGVTEIIGQGETKVTLLLTSGLHLDFLISEPKTYGALLQHFTGSKAHNIHLRTLAEHQGLSLSEYGVRKVNPLTHSIRVDGERSRTIKNEEVTKCETEEELYNLLGMQTPPPEIREDEGEIEAALKHQLPVLLDLKDIKGDFHLHDSFPIEPSHDLGQNSLEEIAKEALSLDYQYIGIADHSPSVSNHNEEEIIQLIKKHKKIIEQYNSSHKNLRVLNLLEVDIQPNGSLSVPDNGLGLLDFAIASIHSVHNMPKEEMTKRILQALTNPAVKIFGHPTGRLINRRRQSDADWEAVFKLTAQRKIALEINASPERLDLPDNLIRIAKALGAKFVIDTDSHDVSQMDLMKFGVAMAKRGWLTKEDVINSWDWTKVFSWFNIKI